MTVKELKKILNSRTELDNCKIKINLAENDGGTCVSLERVECMLEFDDSYNGAVIYLVGCVSDEAREIRSQDPTYEEVQIEQIDYGW